MLISLKKVSGYQSASWWCSGRRRTKDLYDWGIRWTSLEPKHHTPSSTSSWTQVPFCNQFPSSTSTSILVPYSVIVNRIWDILVLIIRYSHWLRSWYTHYRKHTSSHNLASNTVLGHIELPIWWLNAPALFSSTTTMKYREIFHGHENLALHSNSGLSCNHRMCL